MRSLPARCASAESWPSARTPTYSVTSSYRMSWRPRSRLRFVAACSVRSCEGCGAGSIPRCLPSRPRSAPAPATRW
ncbi:hypothetical protein ACFPM0_28535 [Pseudonocardia sulfidoxydans]|uniref:hypothetical protein n=1 Tax=Pseudonocardia sulfidoxydans TaxID=54011 RepID=UPI00362291E3